MTGWGDFAVALVRRHVLLSELDQLDAERASPTRLIAKRRLERRLGVRLAEEEVDRLRVPQLHKRVRVIQAKTGRRSAPTRTRRPRPLAPKGPNARGTSGQRARRVPPPRVPHDQQPVPQQ